MPASRSEALVPIEARGACGRFNFRAFSAVECRRFGTDAFAHGADAFLEASRTPRLRAVRGANDRAAIPAVGPWQ
jgi:hypothetical protein